MTTPAHAADPGGPAAAFPFPVEVPYRMRADLVRLDGPVAPRLPDEAALLAAKRAALATRAARVRVPDPERDPDDLARDVAAALPALASARPDRVRPGATPDAATLHDPDGRAWSFPLLAADDPAVAEGPAWRRLADAAALSFAEDLVWIRDDGGAGRASLLQVAFPSHWPPERRAGASLLELHGPVADGGRLRAASVALTRAIVRKGPFRRHVWSLNPTPALDRHPDADGVAGAPAGQVATLADAWFRVEVQTTVPLPQAGLALFLIRVRVAPLREVLAAAPGRAARLAASIRSMSDAVRRYKGSGTGAEGLLAELDRA
jgi:hypothetical protein